MGIWSLTSRPSYLQVVRDQESGELGFKVKPSTKVGKVFAAFCSNKSLSQSEVRFVHEGGWAPMRQLFLIHCVQCSLLAAKCWLTSNWYFRLLLCATCYILKHSMIPRGPCILGTLKTPENVTIDPEGEYTNE